MIVSGQTVQTVLTGVEFFAFPQKSFKGNHRKGGIECCPENAECLPGLRLAALTGDGSEGGRAALKRARREQKPVRRAEGERCNETRVRSAEKTCAIWFGRQFRCRSQFLADQQMKDFC